MDLTTFRQRFKELDETERTILKLLAIAYEPINQTTLVSLLHECDVRNDRGNQMQGPQVKEYRELLEYTFAEVRRVYDPFIQQLQRTEADDHYNTLVSAHADYDAIAADVKSWVGEQSPARKAAFSSIVKEGTADEIIDLIDLYKQAKGIVKPAAVETPAVAPIVKAVGTPPAAKQAAQRLSVVSSKRSATPAVVADPSDFDAAFDEFVKAGR